MTRTITITADDFGLTRAATDSILDVADHGALTRVSVLANGLAVEYALEQYLERASRLELSLHFNLTEGVALSRPEDIPHLVDGQGHFRYSSVRLFARTLFAGSSTRENFRREIRHELEAQLTRVRMLIADNGTFSIDSHQHIHMIPLVFGVIGEAYASGQFRDVRFPREPFFITTEFPSAYFGGGCIRHLGLNVLSWVNGRTAARIGMPHSGYFIGTLLSGRQTYRSVASALGEVLRKGGNTVEIAFHQGIANSGELDDWRGDTRWHYAPWRAREQHLLKEPRFKTLVKSFSDETASRTGSRFLEIGRFIVAGGISTLTSLGLLFVFTDIVGLWYIASAVIAYGIATVVSFTLQKFWTFSHHSLEKAKREAMFYLLNNLLGAAVDVVGLYVLVEYAGMWYMAAQVLLVVLIAIWNFFVYRFLIFRKR